MRTAHHFLNPTSGKRISQSLDGLEFTAISPSHIPVSLPVGCRIVIVFCRIAVLVLDMIVHLTIAGNSCQQWRPINRRIFVCGFDDEVLEYDSGDEPWALDTALILLSILH